MIEETCEIYSYDTEKGERLKESMKQENMGRAVEIFKALADETRLKVAYALYKEKELCVCDAANVIGASVATTSHHLRLLQTMGLAKKRKEGKQVLYSLDDDHVSGLIELAFEHSKELLDHGRESQ